MTSSRRAFTLVELLVVVGLMAAVFGTIVANSRTGPNVNQAGQDFASALLAAQSRALGRAEGAAVIIESDGTVYYQADMVPPISVPVTDGALVVPPEATADVERSYKLRFRKKMGNGFMTISPWLGLQDSAPVLRSQAGQTSANTILAPRGADIEAVVIRWPRIGVEKKVSRGSRLSLASTGFDASGRMAVVFDQTGRVSEVITGLKDETSPLDVAPFPASHTPSAPIHFDFGEAGASATSVRVTVNPQTGRITVATGS